MPPKIDPNLTRSSPPSPPPVAPTPEEEKEEIEATFPQQLMDVIEHETKNGALTTSGERVIEWLPTAENDQFIIRDKKIFEKQLLPKYFNAKCKFMSFIRKLYRWVIALQSQCFGWAAELVFWPRLWEDGPGSCRCRDAGQVLDL